MLNYAPAGGLLGLKKFRIEGDNLMSTRCRHDLIGCTNQLKNLAHRWNDSVVAVGEHWADATAKKFHDENLGTVNECFARLTASLQEATEFVRKIEKQVGDHGRES